MTLIRLLQVAAVVTILFSFLTGIGIPHPNIELFSHFRPQYLIASVLLLLLSAWMKSPWFAGTLLAAAIFNASFVLPWYQSPEFVPGEAQLKLLLANVHASNTDYRSVVDLVSQEQPDIVILQEVTEKWVRGTAELLQHYPHAYVESRAGNFGIAMYSRLPMNTVQHFDSPPLGYPTIVATLSINGKPLTLISTHPTIPLGKKLFDARNQQLKRVTDLVVQTSGRVVLMGDLNASLWDPRYRQLEQNTGLRNTRYGFGIQPSWPTFMPLAMIPIDHVLVSGGIAVVETRTGKRFGSDHLPLIVTLSM